MTPIMTPMPNAQEFPYLSRKVLHPEKPLNPSKWSEQKWERGMWDPEQGN